MLRKLLLLVSFIVAGTLLSVAQTGSLKITLIDKANNEPMPFANILLEQNGVKVGANQTNMDGEVVFSALPPGRYDIKATYVGYQTLQQTGVIVSADKVTYPKLGMSTSGGVDLTTVVVEEYKAPLISGDVTSGGTVTRDQFINMAQKNVNTIVAQTAGVFQGDQGKGLNVRGSRDDGTVYFVDGVRIVGDNLGVSQLAVEQITTVTGGIPAQYGDATGGIISVSTRGVQPSLFASVRGESSQYLDAFGHNLIAFSMGSPLYSIKDSSGNKKPVVGFIFSGEYTYRKDPNPSAAGTYKVKDDVLKKLETTPLIESPTGAGVVRAAEFVTMNDLEKIKFRQNVAANGVNLNGKLQFKLSDNTDLSVGGRLGYENYHSFVYEYALFNPSNNPQIITNNYSLNARLVQRFNTKTESEKEKSSSIISNAVYTLQAEYTKDKFLQQDDNFKDRIFEYGYVGKFDRYRSRNNYQFEGNYYSNFAFSDSKQAWVQNSSEGDSLIQFTPYAGNQFGANYTSQVFALNNNTIHNFNEIQTDLGMLNGDRPSNIYSLWFNTGRQYGGYNITNNDYFRVYTNFAAKIKDHNIQIGFEYEQRMYRAFNVTPIDLWTLMRNITNSHLTQLDTANPIRVTGSGTFDYIYYNQKYDANTQTQFSKSLREKLGMPINGTNFVNTDGLDPSTYSLDMFSADDLFRSGSSLVGYYGYDHTGKKLSGNVSFDKFFTEKDANGNFKREQPALQPIYIAGYIQDQFDIKDLKFRLGLRIDRFDANQRVLKDKYSLYETKTVGEVTNLGSHPSTMGSDYVVYTDNIENPTRIVGYRNKDVWYTAQGVEINDPNQLAKNAGLSKLYPYLVDPNTTTISPKAFKDYEPQINLMPRIAFAFPISDLAQFNANYDITTQRPTFNSFLPSPSEYLFWSYNAQSPFLRNAALLPQRTTNYEVGFKQVLNERKNSALTISAFYKELRNLIQYRSIIQAYPSQYLTYDNIDFATVKGISVSYDLRRTHNVQLTANYTLQFADGTGSNTGSGYNLATAGIPNLRTIVPLGYDRRHAINLVLDYRFGTKGEYNGPVWVRNKGEDKESVMKLLENVGFNLAMRTGSGTPYSRQSKPTQDVAIGLNQRSTLKGSVNGSNLPWSYWLDLKVDKDMQITFRPEKDGKSAKVGSLNVYLLLLNMLNTQNVLSVYSYTGNAEDDGYLTSAQGSQDIPTQISPTSFQDLYSVKVNNPSNFSIPRSIRLGFTLNY